MKDYDVAFFPEAHLRELDQLFLVNGELQLLPAAAYAPVKHEMLVWWCMKRGFFVLPTVELIEWLQSFVIKGKPAIEICSGRNNLGRYLNIPRTDSFLHQKSLEYRLLSLVMGHMPIFPSSDVLDIDANEAVKKYKPEVVIASWSVEKGDGGVQSKVGVDELAIVDQVNTYCLLGSDHTHSKKKIFKRPHQRFELPFLISRSFNGIGVAWVWEK